MIECPEIPNIRHLRMVQTIGRLGGVSSAARELNTSQPAVTQAVSNLERDIGTEIFERRATGTYPTSIGKLFLLRIDRFFDILERALEILLANGKSEMHRHAPLVDRIITGTQMRSLVVTSEPATLEEVAIQLGVTPESLYRSVRDLERALDQSLVDRTATGLVCNRAGEYLARQFRQAVREIEFAKVEISLAIGKEDMEIVIGALPMSGAYKLANAVRIFVERRPSARVRILTGDYLSLLNDLGNCRIDMIFGLLRRPDWATDVNEEVFFTDSFCIAVRKGHPLTRVRDVTPAELARFDWIVPAKGTPRREQIERLFEGGLKKPRFGIETSSLTTLRALLVDSDLITVMTRSEVRFDSRIGVIESIPCRFLEPIPPKGITTRGDWLPTGTHLAFLECLREATCGTSDDERDVRARVALVS